MSWWKPSKQDPKEQARDFAIFYSCIAVLFGLGALNSATRDWYLPVGWAVLAAIFAWRAWNHLLPLQYSMRTLMIALTIAALVMGILGAILRRW